MNWPTDHTYVAEGVDLKRDQRVYSKWYPGLIRNLFRCHRHTGKLPKIYNPVTFNDKIWRRLVFDRRPILTQLADKLAVREYVCSKVGNEVLPRVYLRTDSIAKIVDKSLPASFVAKTTHGSGWTYIVPDKNKTDLVRLQRFLSCWLGQNYYNRKGEWAYKNITPRILVEELLLDNQRIPDDYKFYCFDGEIVLIQVDKDRFAGHQRWFLDTSWTVVPNRPYAPKNQDKPSGPFSLTFMMDVARELSRSFDFLRVDLYEVNPPVA